MADNSPELGAMVPLLTTAEIINVIYEGGAINYGNMLSWAVTNRGEEGVKIDKKAYAAGLWHLPLIDSDNAALRDFGTCAAMDRAGDVWWMRFTRHGRAGTWAVIGGTGKYRGMTGSGTLHDDLVTPDGRVQLTWQGKVEMRPQ